MTKSCCKVLSRGCVASLFSWSLLTSAAFGQVPFHVTHLWHMHQPIYWPYESVQDTDNNNRLPYNIQSSVFDGDRMSSYRYWPPNAVRYAHDRGMPHAGSQVSYSGSLAENMNNIVGFNNDTGDYRDARNNKRTSLGNPRLDIVGIAYHHSLMPLTSKESMRMQIKLHKEQYFDRWNTTEYSKGFWPPECAFDVNMIPALVAEGLEWVIVDNGHLFRTASDFPWSSASSCKPNQADLINGSSTNLNSQWVQLQNVWAPTPVLAPWSYQPHHVQYVNPDSGAIQRIIAVPGARYEGNENGRGGYGAFKPENVWGQNGGANTDAQKPMLILLHSDGDNYGMKNADAWNGQQNLFLDMVQNNASFEYTSVQDYLQMFPPSANDVVHIEPGTWIGIDGGTPYYEKWLTHEYRDGVNPDRWSWSVLVAAQNRVILADTLDSNYSMNDVEWGIGNDTAKAWHWYLAAETSCHWYWDYSGEPWDGHPTRAANQAVAYAMNIINAHPGQDSKGPSIFPPQRNYYNPGSYMWDPTDLDPSDFTVWSFVDDVSGLQSVILKWRTDKDGFNPLSSIQNETYAGGDEVNGWNSVPMTGAWDPVNKINVSPDPVARAQMYSGDITGQNNVLIDYYIEAIDTVGNVSRSDIIHVFVGDQQINPPDDRLAITTVTTYPGPNHDNDQLNPEEDLWIDAYTAGTTPNAVTLHYSVGGGAWQSTAMQANAANGAGAWHKNLGVFDAGTCVAFMITASDASETVTNDNAGANYSICSVSDTSASASFDPAAPTGCGPVTITYTPNGGPLATATQVYIHVGYNGWAGVLDPPPAMTQAGDSWTYSYDPVEGTYEINCVFHDGGGTWDNHGGSDWMVAVSDCDGPVPPLAGFAITNPVANILTPDATVALRGIAEGCTGSLVWSNALTGQVGSQPVASPWLIPAIPVAVGDNLIMVSGSINTTNGPVTVAEDSASDAAYADGWADADNGGSGFEAWTLGGATAAGTFTSTNGWGLWSQEGDNLAEAVRPLAAPLAVGQTLKVRIKNGWIWESGGSVGIALRDGSGTTLWELYFNGGLTNYDTSAGMTDIAWTDAGLDVAFTLTGATNYTVAITPEGGSASEYSGTLAGPVAQFRAWSYNNGTDDGNNSNRDFFFNHLSVMSAGGVVSQATNDTITITRAAGGWVDSDGDGISDEWESRHGNGPTALNALDDLDNDGRSNYEEFMEDTNPTNPASVYPSRIEHAQVAGVLWLRVGAPTSTQRLYDVFWSTNLEAGQWNAEGRDQPGTGGEMLLPVTNLQACRFYRTGVALPPPSP